MNPFRRFLSRCASLFGRQSYEARMREEFEDHIERLTEANIESGMTPEEARRQATLQFGPHEPAKEAYRDQRGLPRLEALVSDVIFGWRQLRKHPAASAAAILSLALAIGATTAAFRLVDAALLRKLPIAEPDRLSYIAITFVDREGRPDTRIDFDYPTFRQYRETVADRADLLLVGMISRQDVIFSNSNETERMYRQFVSGNLFSVFGLQPAIGRVLTVEDDARPGGHPVGVISYDYWTRRFGRDRDVIGKTFRMGSASYTIVGVAPKGFTGTEPGEVSDVFVPSMMNAEALKSPGWVWFRIWARPKPGFSPEQVRQPLQTVFTHESGTCKTFSH